MVSVLVEALMSEARMEMEKVQQTHANINMYDEAQSQELMSRMSTRSRHT